MYVDCELQVTAELDGALQDWSRPVAVGQVWCSSL